MIVRGLDAIPSAAAIAFLQQIAPLVVHARYRPLMVYFGGSMLVSLMWEWNWQLVLATGTGIGCMGLVYLLPQYQEQWRQWQTFFQSLSGKMTISVGCGGITALSTYGLATTWTDPSHTGLQIVLLLQAGGTMTALGLLLWQWVISNQGQSQNEWQRWLPALTANESLKRLMAVRELTALADQQRLNSEQYQQLVEYFSLMLTQEREAMIRQALLTTLQNWQETVSPAITEPLRIPLSRQRSQIYRPINLD